MATLYVKTHCSDCTRLKSAMARAGIALPTRNVDTDARAFDEARRHDIRSVPAIVDDQGTVFVGSQQCMEALGIR